MNGQPGKAGKFQIRAARAGIHPILGEVVCRYFSADEPMRKPAAVGNVLGFLGFLKKQMHYATKATHGAGVEELIDKLIASDSERGTRSPDSKVSSVL